MQRTCKRPPEQLQAEPPPPLALVIGCNETFPGSPVTSPLILMVQPDRKSSNGVMMKYSDK